MTKNGTYDSRGSQGRGGEENARPAFRRRRRARGRPVRAVSLPFLLHGAATDVLSSSVAAAVSDIPPTSAIVKTERAEPE
jgi:hypothetical protein